MQHIADHLWMACSSHWFSSGTDRRRGPWGEPETGFTWKNGF